MGENSEDTFGTSVNVAGDLNGDFWLGDVVVGAPENDATGDNAGRAYVYFGGLAPNATPDVILSGLAALEGLGSSVSYAGDVNFDGYGDLIVGAARSDFGGSNAGRAYVYVGGNTPDTTADLILTGEAALDEFGAAVALGGDFNGDGQRDILVGAPQYEVGGGIAGRAYLYEIRRARWGGR